MKRAGAVIGLILCGGESRRMGADKGLLEVDGKPWALMLGEKIAALHIPVFYSLRHAQLDSYSRYFDGHQLIEDDAAGEGPMRGLLSAHQAFPDKDILLLACDMPDMDPSLLSELLSAYASQDHAFYAYREDPYYQTFPAIYTARGMVEWNAMNSLQSMLRAGDTYALPVNDPAAFRNYNEPQ